MIRRRGRTYQITLDGRGDPDQHKDFAEILACCRGEDNHPLRAEQQFFSTSHTAPAFRRFPGRYRCAKRRVWGQ